MAKVSDSAPVPAPHRFPWWIELVLLLRRAARELAAFVDDADAVARASVAAGRLAAERHSLELLSEKFCDIVERDGVEARASRGRRRQALRN